MKTSRRRRIGGALVCLALVGVAAPVHALTRPSAHGPAAATTLSGTIVDGTFTTASAMSCALQPDCAVWLAAGCPSALAGIDPAWHASIVGVADRAGTPRVFEVRRGTGESVILGGVVVEFWTSDCTTLEPSWSSFWGPWNCEYPACGSEPRYLENLRLGSERAWATLRIPAEAAWMTISANDNLNVVWTLE